MKKFLLFLLWSCLTTSLMAQNLRVATYNIRVDTDYDAQRGFEWNGRKTDVARLIRFYDFDIFGIQEARFNQVNDLNSALNNYESWGVGRDDGHNKGEQCRIYFKKNRFTLQDKGFFWLAPENKPIRGWDASYVRICVWSKLKDTHNGTSIIVCCTHLDNNGEKARNEGVKMILNKAQHIGQGLPLILLGDFNSDQNAQAYQTLQTSDIVKDTYTLTDEPYCPNGTYVDFDNNQATNSRIDHIFVSDHWTVKRWGVLTNTFHRGISGNTDSTTDGKNILLRKDTARMPSDHYPVMCDLIYARKVSTNNKQHRQLRILSIGNSYSRDAFSYVPFILKNIDPNIDLTFGILYYGGMTLEGHWQRMSEGSAVYQYNKSEQGKGWSLTKDVSALQVLQDEHWDIVCLQQASHHSPDYSHYQPYLHNIIRWIYDNTKYPLKLAWMLTPAYPEGKDFLLKAGMNSDNMFHRIAECAQRVMEETPIEILFPCGTAIQNARHTILDRYGKFGHLSYEGLHLQEGIAPQMEAYVAVMTILNELGSTKSVLGDQTRITPQWYVGKNIPEPDGNPQGSDDEGCYIGQQCSISAFKNPFKVTLISQPSINSSKIVK